MRYFIIVKGTSPNEISNSAVFTLDEILKDGEVEIEEDERIVEIKLGDIFKRETKNKLIKID